MTKLNDELKQYLSVTRQKLHAYPELSMAEFHTSDFIFDELKGMGYKPYKILTGVVCDIVGRDKYVIALRSDMDALPITETSANPNPSQNSGISHACGHDAHMATLLTLARFLSTTTPKVSVRLIFQFGEEGYGGAEQMIEKGVLDGVDEIYAYHVCPELASGHLATTDGALFAGAVEFDVKFDGKASHCAMRSNGIDSIKAGVKLCEAVERLDKSENNILMHVGKFDGGTARNVVAEITKLDLTLRFFDFFTEEKVMMELARELISIDNTYHTTHTLTVLALYPPLINSPDAVSKLRRLTEIEEIEPRYTAEDFAFYLQKVVGCMVWLGVKGENYTPLHSSNFDLDNSSLVRGVELFADIVM